jgi:hypothetical protein
MFLFLARKQENLPKYLCPTEELGLLMSSLYVKINALYAGSERGE